MSGNPATGSTNSTVWPSSLYVCRSVSHWFIATWTSTVVEVSIHGLIAYSTVKKVGGVIAYRRMVGVRCFVAATSDTGAAEAATSEIVMIKRYFLMIVQSIADYCMSANDLLRDGEKYGSLLRGG